MAERSYESNDNKDTNDRVNRLCRNLSLVGGNYVDARMALQEFIESEFSVGEVFSDRYIARLEAERILPTDISYEEDVQAALDWHRQAMYCYWIPLYRETHTADEFSVWLPAAMDVVIPPNSGHSRESCDPELTSPASIPLYGTSCPTSALCLVRLVGGDVLLNVPYLPVDDMEMIPYEQQACNPARLRSDANMLLAVLYDKRVITASQMREAKARYDRAYASLSV